MGRPLRADSRQSMCSTLTLAGPFKAVANSVAAAKWPSESRRSRLANPKLAYDVRGADRDGAAQENHKLCGFSWKGTDYGFFPVRTMVSRPCSF